MTIRYALREINVVYQICKKWSSTHIQFHQCKRPHELSFQDTYKPEFSQSIKLCILVPTTDQVNSFFQSYVLNCQSL